MPSTSLRNCGLAGAALAALLFTGCSKKSEEAPTASNPPPVESAPPANPAPAGAPVAPGPNGDARQYVDFGMANGARGDLDGAVSAFKTAIKLDPNFAPAYYNLGYANSLQGQTDEAMKNLDQAIQLDPNYRDAYNQRGNLKGKRGNFGDAIADFQQVVRLDPNFALGYYNLGHVDYFTGDLDEAVKQLDHALALDPNLSDAHFIRGLIRHAQGHTTEAIADFRMSLGLNFPYAAFWLFLAETQDGLPDAARRDLTDALARPEVFKPDDFPTAIGNFLLGRLPQDGLIAKAAATHEDLRQDSLCSAWYYAGALQHIGGNFPGARDDFTQAIATQSKGSEEYVEAKRELALLPGL